MEKKLRVGILGGTTLGAGTYYAKIGGKGLDEIIVETFTIVEESQGRTIQLGDVNMADGIGTPDINAILNHMTGLEVLNGDNAVAADANQADGIGTPDVNAILNHMTGLELLGTVTVK